MKMLMIQLVCAAAVLVSSVSPHPPHNRIIDIINSYNSTLNEQLYVESVEHLYYSDDKCSNAFFCKAHDILVKHSNASGNEKDISLMRNLKQVNQKVNCEEILKTVDSSRDTILFPRFLYYLKKCIQCRNSKSNEPSC